MGNIKYVDMKKSLRRNIHKLYRSLDYPYFGFTINIDVTHLYHYCKANQLSFFKTMLFFSAMTANSIKEFRYRLLDDKVVEYDVVHPSYILLIEEDAFNFCTVEYKDEFSEFYQNAIRNAENLKGNIDLDHEEERDDLFFVTCTPWYSFTSILHPAHMHPVDSIPRISWGKYFDEGKQKKMPFGIHANHALMDGFHLGLYFDKLQNLIDHPELHL